MEGFFPFLPDDVGRLPRFLRSFAWVNEVVLRTGSVPLNIIFPGFPRNFPFTDPRVVRFYIRRVMSQMTTRNTVDDSKLTLALSLAPRSHTFIAKIYLWNWEILLADLCHSQMPSLHTLSVAIEGEANRNLTLPTALCSEGVPCLRNLTLYGCNADLSSSVFQTLTTLSISNLGFQSSLVPARWLKVLSALHELEELILFHAFLDRRTIEWDIQVTMDNSLIFDIETTALPVVELTRLKYLKLVGISEILNPVAN